MIWNNYSTLLSGVGTLRALVTAKKQKGAEALGSSLYTLHHMTTEDTLLLPDGLVSLLFDSFDRSVTRSRSAGMKLLTLFLDC